MARRLFVSGYSSPSIDWLYWFSVDWLMDWLDWFITFEYLFLFSAFANRFNNLLCVDFFFCLTLCSSWFFKQQMRGPLTAHTPPQTRGVPVMVNSFQPPFTQSRLGAPQNPIGSVWIANFCGNLMAVVFFSKKFLIFFRQQMRRPPTNESSPPARGVPATDNHFQARPMSSPTAMQQRPMPNVCFSIQMLDLNLFCRQEKVLQNF